MTWIWLQEDDLNWLENEDSQLVTEDDVKSMAYEDIHPHDLLPILVPSEVQPIDQKPAVSRKKIQENGKAKPKATRQKRNDFLIDDQKRVVCLQCLKSYATRKSFRRHYLMYVVGNRWLVTHN